MGKLRSPNHPTGTQFVASVLPGVEDLAKDEIIRRTKGRAGFLPSKRQDEHRVILDGDAGSFLQLRIVQAVHRAGSFEVKGPGSLMSEPMFPRVVRLIRSAIELTGDAAWDGLRFDAAGSDSETFRQFGQKLAAELGIPFRSSDGDLLITVRPAENGWEVMCRIGRRPLSTRPWRKADFRGALNATLAAAMVELSKPDQQDRFCNLMCGSGTIVVERLLRRGAKRVVGVDISSGLLAKAQANADGAGLGDRVELVEAAVADPKLADGSFDVVCADLPWGEAVGKRGTNANLYEQFFRTSHRILGSGGRLVALTLDTVSLDQVAEEITPLFKTVGMRVFNQRGYRSRCTLYERIS
ncbi:MAG: hypothetical protein CME19_16065 [Gemmatimonadetes bacterium]|nr:hypothetical protein [Gemmatimonadota bacterium]|tara:strand:- start:1762 stop:2823 length:1062 start_codon:yes stop_codon:yes gene_type:complete